MDKYIVTTRPQEKVAPDISSVCFDIVNIPVTKLEINMEFEPSAVLSFEPTIAIFTSSYGVSAFLSRWAYSLDNDVKVIAIGDETARRLRGRYTQVIVPEEKSSKGITQLLESIVGPRERVVLFVSSKSNGLIEHYLQEKGIEYLLEELYLAEQVPGEEFKEAVMDPDCFGIIFTSSYEARVAFTEILANDETQTILLDKKIFAIGKTTAAELAELKIPVSEPLGESSLEKLVREIDRMYCPGE